MRALKSSGWDRRLLTFCLLVSAGFLSICSKSSFLYPMNDWVDVHCFFTMGRSIWDGLVPYRDLYEQKGPVLYFLYALAALISSHSFLGVFALEVISFALFLYFSGLISRIYLGNSWITYGIITVLAAVIPVSPAFAHGSGAEEFCLFMLTYSLYSVLLALSEDRPLTFREAFWNGIFAAAVLYIKFTILGFYIGLALFVLLWYLSKACRLKTLLSTIGQFLLGVFALSAVVFGYFLIHGAVDDFIRVYFYNNIFLYPTELEGSRWKMILGCLEKTISVNSSYSGLFYCGLLFLAAGIVRYWRNLLMVLLTFAGLVVGTYWGGRGYTYYGLILSVYSVFGLIGIVKLVQLIPLRRLLDRTFGSIPFAKHVAIAAALVLMLSYSFHNSRNAYLMKYTKEDMPAYRFAATIQQKPNARILNYGFLDGGFYYAADITPNCEFFCTLNIDAPDMWKIQRECIQNGEVDFVITRKYTLDQYTANSSKYTCVDEATFPFEGVDFTYYLYQKIPYA